MCSNTIAHLKGYHCLFAHDQTPDLKDSQLFDCPEVCLLVASDSPACPVCLSLHFGNTSGLSL